MVCIENYQQTILKPVKFDGLALHSGHHTSVTLHPVPVDFGVQFSRVDMSNTPLISASLENIIDTTRCTTIGTSNICISTVEHLLSALSGLEIDNILIEISGDEIPILDGSSLELCRLIQDTGVVRLPKVKKIHKIVEPVFVSNGSSYAFAVPYDSFKISAIFTNDHHHPAYSDQLFECEMSPEFYVSQVSPARTFGFMKEADLLKRMDLIKGVNESNVIQIDDDKIITPLRFENEFVRHKVLDIMGDLSVLGSLKVHVIAIRPSHSINHSLAVGISKQITEKNL